MTARRRVKLLASFDQAVVHRVDGLLRKQRVDSLDSETVFLDRSDSNLHHYGYSPSAKSRPTREARNRKCRCVLETKIKDKDPYLDVQRASRAYLPERVAGALGAILPAMSTTYLDAVGTRPRHAHERRQCVHDRAEPPNDFSSTADSAAGAGPPGERVPSCIAEYLDPTSTAKHAVSGTPNVPVSTAARPPLPSPVHPIPTTSSIKRVPAGPTPSHEAAHPRRSRLLGHGRRERACSSSSPVSRHDVRRSGPGPAPPPPQGVRRSRAPCAVCPRRGPGFATPSALVQAFAKSARAPTTPLPPKDEPLGTSTRLH
ncbi:hypothetical protein DFH11DRAFT_1882513 [Phellopilus nigrolimitatus]|nr:hypothetical protein DFH11DRAFT_1882513 [Phellopilus nigrolimitatus]